MAQASAYLIFCFLIKFSCGQYESAVRQSPIDIVTTDIVTTDTRGDLGPLRPRYRPATLANVENTSKSFQVNFFDKGFALVTAVSTRWTGRVMRLSSTSSISTPPSTRVQERRLTRRMAFLWLEYFSQSDHRTILSLKRSARGLLRSKTQRILCPWRMKLTWTTFFLTIKNFSHISAPSQLPHFMNQWHGWCSDRMWKYLRDRCVQGVFS